MKLLQTTVIGLLLLSGVYAQSKTSTTFLTQKKDQLSTLSTNSIDKNWLNQAEKYIAESEYFFKQSEKTGSPLFYASNRAQRVSFQITPTDCKVTPVKFAGKTTVSWTQTFSFLEIAKGETHLTAGSDFKTDYKESGLNFNYPAFRIEYRNSEKGLRQNFVVFQKPAGENNLEVLLQMTGNLKATVENNGLRFFDKKGKTSLIYNDLKVWDANNKTIDATMQLREDNILAIVINDRNATYPLTIDPINKTAETTYTADGVLPALIGQLAIDAAYGFSVAGLGDVNGDGFDDVAIGSPLMADVITGTGSVAGVGGVFVYYGSLSGLPALPNAALQPTTAVAGALFGYSIAGGDINNDGKSDLIVGAPLDQITISIGGGMFASGNVGKVYVYDGVNLTGNPSPLITLELSGNSIIRNGINLSLQALFGFSVSVTEDLNGDGKKDMIVGAPTYAGIKFDIFNNPSLDVKSGGAFIFLTNAIDNTTSLVKLEPIKTTILGLGLLESNINGLLFGYCVDGLGDYNNDGNPDVVVTAPAGIDVSSINVLLNNKLFQGSAVVYYGNGSGVGTDPGATLVATAGGLLTNIVGSIANLANMFGVSVRGLKTDLGVRNGGLIVGAPLGGALVNLLSIDVKTGTVSVFKKKNSSPAGNVVPDQVITSPRDDSNILDLMQSSAFFGYSLDNTFDLNCDGFNDIIVGEPIASGAELLNANVTGGAAYVYLGQANGLFSATPSWTLSATEDAFLGINATSLMGYSVAGAGHTRGITFNNRILVGTPSRTLDFGAGLLNLGATLGTLFSLTSGDNGLGKAYIFDTQFCGGGGPLPITLLKFNASYADGITSLNWKTSQEINSNYFDVERSSDGVTFTAIGKVSAAGNSAKETTYNFNDIKVNAGLNYYRLKMVSKDGKITYSNVVAINVSIKGTVVTGVYPSPFINKINISISAEQAGKVNIVLFDNVGKQIASQQNVVVKGANTIVLDNLDHLARGTYIVKIKAGTSVTLQKVMK